MADQEVFTGPWYPWYVDDVLTSEAVDLMSLAEEGAYRRALDKAWKKGSIPAPYKDLARTIGKSCPIKVAERVSKMFVPMPGNPDRLIHLKLEKIRLEQFAKYKKHSESGKEGAKKRWRTDGDANGDAIKTPMANGWHSESEVEEEIKNKNKDLATASPMETKTKPDDPRKNHPAIVAVREVVNRYPPKEIWDLIIDQLGMEIELVRLKLCFTNWAARGYNKTNFQGWIDWYHSGIPKATNPKTGNQKYGNGHKATSADRIADHAAIISQYPTEAELRDKSGKN